MAKTKEQLEADLAAANTRIAELEQQVAAGGADHSVCEQKLAEKQTALDEAIANVQQLNGLLSKQAIPGDVRDAGVEIRQTKMCGAVEADTPLAFVMLAPGIDMNFVVDAVRSGMARVCDVPSIEEEQVDADAE